MGIDLRQPSSFFDFMAWRGCEDVARCPDEGLLSGVGGRAGALFSTALITPRSFSPPSRVSFFSLSPTSELLWFAQRSLLPPKLHQLDIGPEILRPRNDDECATVLSSSDTVIPRGPHRPTQSLQVPRYLLEHAQSNGYRQIAHVR